MSCDACASNTTYFPDGEHPSIAGHAILGSDRAGGSPESVVAFQLAPSNGAQSAPAPAGSDSNRLPARSAQWIVGSRRSCSVDSRRFRNRMPRYPGSAVESQLMRSCFDSRAHEASLALEPTRATREILRTIIRPPELTERFFRRPDFIQVVSVIQFAVLHDQLDIGAVADVV